MLINQITIYVCKNTRKNSKCIIKTLKAFRNDDGMKMNNIKANITEDDISDLIQFLNLENEFNACYRLVVYTGNINLRNWNTGYFTDKESLLRSVRKFTELLNY